MPPRSPLQPEASLPQLPGALAADSSSLSLCLGSVLGCVWSVRGTEAWLHASMRDNPEGHPGSRFLVRWAEVLVVRAAAPPCAGSAPGSAPRNHLLVLRISNSRVCFPGNPTRQKLGVCMCMYF